jgi:uncharacterized protein YjbI with pentapeptide repeats
LVKCKYTQEFVNFECNEITDLPSGLCIFHDQQYLKDDDNQFTHKKNVLNQLWAKINHDITKYNKVECIGYYIPDIKFSEIINDNLINRINQTKIDFNFNFATFLGKASFSRVSFSGKASFFGAKFSEANFFWATFSGQADFSRTKFFGEAKFQGSIFSEEATFHRTEFSKKTSFSGAEFIGEANFSGVSFSEEANFFWAKFSDIVYFNKIIFGKFANFRYVIFALPEKVFFHSDRLTYVSFLNTDITRVNFSDTCIFGEDESEDKIIEERELEDIFKDDKQENTKDITKTNTILKDVNLDSIIAIYRNLRENYEYKLRYSKAGQFFIREMELQRKYCKVKTKMLKNNRGNEKDESENEGTETGKITIKKNKWYIQNFSLTGLYYWLSKYGQDLLRPFLFTMGILIFSTLFWMLQPNAFTSEPSIIEFTGVQEIVEGNSTHIIKSFERSISSLIPFISPGLNLGIEKTVFADIVFTATGLLAFGLLIISLRRKFERRFRH